MELTEILLIVFAIIASIEAAVILVFCLWKRCGQRKQNAREVHSYKDYDVEAQRSVYRGHNASLPGPSYPYAKLVNPRFPGYKQQNRPQSVTSSLGNKTPAKIDALDLHHFTVKEAMVQFKEFLAEALKVYEIHRNSNSNRTYRFIEVITGRGNHSPNNVPVIKPAVEDYLQKHQYKFVWANPGKVRIDLMSAFRSEA